MADLRQQLEQLLTGRVCFMGSGNVEYGDDAFGVRLAEALTGAGVPDVIIAGTAPDRWIGQLAAFDHVVFLDAIEFGGAPGDAIFLDSPEMASRFPQISTHKISLSLLAQWVEASGKTKAWLLGTQPESLCARQAITPAVCKTVDLLCELISTSQAGTATPDPGANTLGTLAEVNV